MKDKNPKVRMMIGWIPGRPLADAVAEAIRETLLYTDGNKMQAASMLEMSIGSLRRWVRMHPRLSEFYIRPIDVQGLRSQ